MKKRTATFLVALCLASSLSFADSPTDDPLVVTDAYASLRSDQSASVAKNHADKKKTKTCPPQTAQNTVNSENQHAPQNPQTEMSPTI
jgi:hypothetical protein